MAASFKHGKEATGSLTCGDLLGVRGPVSFLRRAPLPSVCQLALCETFSFLSNATTCSYELVISLLVVAIVQPTSEVGTPMRRDYVVPMM